MISNSFSAVLILIRRAKPVKPLLEHLFLAPCFTLAEILEWNIIVLETPWLLR
jgi:hypothetical protein